MADLFAKKVTGCSSKKRAWLLNVAIRVHRRTKRSERRQVKATPRTLLAKQAERRQLFFFVISGTISDGGVEHGVLLDPLPFLEIAEAFVMSPCRKLTRELEIYEQKPSSPTATGQSPSTCSGPQQA